MQREAGWQPTACILCSLNCGIEIQVEDGRIRRVRGDKAHPASLGYLGQEAARLECYQNHERRLRFPQRRRQDGTFERVDRETALREIAARLRAIRDTRGSHAIAHAGAFRAALRTPYIDNSLAQETRRTATP